MVSRYQLRQLEVARRSLNSSPTKSVAPKVKHPLGDVPFQAGSLVAPSAELWCVLPGAAGRKGHSARAGGVPAAALHVDRGRPAPHRRVAFGNRRRARQGTRL